MILETSLPLSPAEGDAKCGIVTRRTVAWGTTMVDVPASDDRSVSAEALTRATQEVLDRVKDVSGLPVTVLPDPTLTTMAAMRIARGAVPMHTISYKPSASSRPDYLICFQCGFLIRMFAVPPAERCLFGGTAKGAYQIERLLSKEGIARKLGLPVEPN